MSGLPLYPGSRTSPRAALVSLIAVLASVVLGACGLSQRDWEYYRDLVAVDALVDDGQYTEARAGYLELAWRSQREDLLRYIQLRVALTHELAGETDEALAQYDRIVATPRSRYDHDASNAALRAATLRRTDDVAAWRTSLVTVIQTFPDAIFADDALTELLRSYDETGEHAALAELLTELYLSHWRSEVGDNLAYWLARTVDEKLGMCADAIELYGNVMHQYRRSGLVDDSIWRTAACHRQLGDIDSELRMLEDFFDAREVSFVMADYESVHYRPALRRIAEIHESRGELREAIAVWQRHIRKYPLSLQIDDMLYHVMGLQQQLGDVDGMRDTLRRLERDWPDSRWTRRGRERLAEAEAG